MTVGKPEFNLDSFGIKYVKKTLSTGSTPSTEKTPHGLDKPKDKLDFGHNNVLTPDHDTTTSYGAVPEGGTGTTTHGSGKNQGSNAKTSKFGTYDSPKNTPQGNKITYKKPEGEPTLPKNAAMQLAIIKCKLLKLKSSSGDINTSAAEYNKKETVEESAKKYLKETEKGTGDKIPHEKLGDLPQGADDKEVESATIVNEKGEEKKLPSPADRYKADVRSMAIDAIDIAMKNIADYQDKKEKALQEELIKDAYEAQLKNDSANTSDGVNTVYSDVKQKKVNTE